jgi:hypothetical protein
MGRGVWVPAFAGTTQEGFKISNNSSHSFAISRLDSPEVC